MPAGLRVIGDAGYTQIDENYRNQKLVYSGTFAASTSGSALQFTGNLDLRKECPLVFVRTTGWFGSFELVDWYGSPEYKQGTMLFQCTAAVDVAIFMAEGPESGDTFGLRVWDAAGKQVYHSGNRYARIQAIPAINGSVTSGSASFTALGQRPWMCANPLSTGLSAPLGSGSDLSYPPYCVYAACSDGLVQYKFAENGRPQDGPTSGSNVRLSPYNGRQLQIPVALIPGL